MKLILSYPNFFQKSHFQKQQGITVGVCPDDPKTALNLEKLALRLGKGSLHCQTNPLPLLEKHNETRFHHNLLTLQNGIEYP